MTRLIPMRTTTRHTPSRNGAPAFRRGEGNTRNQCEYHRGRIAAHIDPLLARFREMVIGQARHHGCLDPTAPRSTVELQRATFAAVDGKVIRSPAPGLQT